MSGTTESILYDLTPEALAIAVKGNLFAWFKHMEDGEYTAHTGKGLRVWSGGVPDPWLNGIRTERPAETVAEAEIDALLNLFAGHNGDISWWLAPGVAVEPWRSRLEPRGLAYEAATPGMAIALTEQAAGGAAAAAQPDLEIKIMQSAADLRQWSEVFVDGYELPRDWLEGVYNLVCTWGCDLPFRHFLGVVDGEPLATSSLLLGGGVAGVHNVAVLPAARRRGIGAAMTQVVLAHGHSLGYRAAILQSSELGLPVYRRMGFTEVCKVDLFAGRAPAA
jgi:ribosomal protein S18 acetylase RimI-like enzyme